MNKLLSALTRKFHNAHEELIEWRAAFSTGAILLTTCFATGAAWPAVEQPDLKQALDNAPLLETESLGEPARGVNVWERWFVPNPDGQTWDLLQIYFKEYYGPTWLHAVDLGTGTVKKQRLPDGHQFYLSGRALGFDGKFYIATPSRRTGGMGMFVYDPGTNTIEDRGVIVPGLGGEVRPLVTGPDGRIYGTGTRGKQVGLYIYDPKSRKRVSPEYLHQPGCSVGFGHAPRVAHRISRRDLAHDESW